MITIKTQEIDALKKAAEVAKMPIYIIVEDSLVGYDPKKQELNIRELNSEYKLYPYYPWSPATSPIITYTTSTNDTTGK